MPTYLLVAHQTAQVRSYLAPPSNYSRKIQMPGLFCWCRQHL